MHMKFGIGQRVFVPVANKCGVVSARDNNPTLGQYPYRVDFEGVCGYWYLEREICDAIPTLKDKPTPAAEQKLTDYDKELIAQAVARSGEFISREEMLNYAESLRQTFMAIQKF